MKNLILLFVFTLLGTVSYAQDGDEKNPNDINMSVKTDREAQYPDGDQALATYVFLNTEYSDEAIEARAEGNVTISYMVNTDSTLSDFQVLMDIKPTVGPQIVKLLKTIKYIPAIENKTLIRRQKMMTFFVRAFKK